ncbi:MAG: DEAD/DEAH box helicase, partial [Xanthomonadaceae bacterium]|nr:DEAD/DEAH box helicase [Xanthomonadaceae bacterium]
QLLPSGVQRLAPCIDEHDERVWLETTPPHLLDLERRLWHPVRFAPAGPRALEWLARPDLAPEAVDSALAELESRDPQGCLPRPQQLRRSFERARAPRPSLVLAALTNLHCGPDDDAAAAAADLHFCYGDTRVAWDLVGPNVLREPDEVVEVQRDFEREQACLDALKAGGLKPYEAPPPHRASPVHRVLAVHSNRRERVGRPWVADLGGSACADPAPVWTGLRERLRLADPETEWSIDERADFPFQVIRPRQWFSRVAPQGDARGQVSLDFGFMLDGRAVSLLAALVRRLADIPGEWLQQLALGLGTAVDSELLIRIDDLRLVALPGDRLTELMSLIGDHAGDASIEDRVVFSRARLSDVEQAARSGEMHGPGELRLLARQLAGSSPLDCVAAPKGLRAELRPYQADGLNWLQFLAVNDFAGVLADDMGLGKTVQTLAHILLEKQAGRLDHPVLVVAPTSLLFNWRAEARRFAPDLKVLVLHGPQRRREFHRLSRQDLVLTSYALVTRDIEMLERQCFHLVLLDEAQYIKNPRARISQAVRRLDAHHRLALSGTPIENHLGELWSLFDFLMPGLLGDAKAFKRYFREPIERDQNAARAHELNRRIRPFLMRRTKTEVAPELPEKIEIMRIAELASAQRGLYDRVRSELYGRVSQAVEAHGLARSRIVVLDALLRLRQICCDPRLLRDLNPEDWAGRSAKLDLLMEMLPKLLSEGRRILLFSQFTGMLNLIEQELHKRALEWVKLTGRTRDRQAPVRRFQQREVALFLVSLKAGGVGLNLTAADTVIHYDPWWNPATEDQATDRAHRIGQDKTVMVYRLYAEDTVEQKIRLMQQSKRQLVQDLLAGGGAAHLNAEDLAFLFGSTRD